MARDWKVNALELSIPKWVWIGVFGGLATILVWMGADVLSSVLFNSALESPTIIEYGFVDAGETVFGLFLYLVIAIVLRLAYKDLFSLDWVGALAVSTIVLRAFHVYVLFDAIITHGLYFDVLVVSVFGFLICASFYIIINVTSIKLFAYDEVLID